LYYPHFGLKEPPFKITPNTDFFFSGGNRGAILDALVYAITNGEGIIKVVGEVGSGKTMLCRMLQTILPERIESIYLANPSVAPEDVLHAIAFELQLKLPKNADRLKVMQALQAYLLARYAEGRQVVIFVEEAQGMPLATLEEIRLLSNLETKQDKLLQIVLFGQPELDDNLNQEHIRQLRERITHRFNLGPLQTRDVGEYLIFRLRAAGYHGPHLFTESAIKKLSKASEGLVRRINILADKALLSAFADNVYQITPKHVYAAINDSEFGLKPKWYQLDMAKTGLDRQYTWRTVLWIAMAGLGISAAFFAYTNWSQPKPKPVVGADKRAEKSNLLPAVTASTADIAPATVIDVQQLLVNQRLQATDNLLSSTSPETISLQIQSVPAVLTAGELPQDALLKTALEKLRRQLEMDNVYLYRMQQGGSVYTVILYGVFAQRADALNALSSLPEEIKINQPYLRTLAGVKKDIEQSQKVRQTL
jgi:type II secretory pathway predicted ATPase ExeA